MYTHHGARVRDTHHGARVAYTHQGAANTHQSAFNTHQGVSHTPTRVPLTHPPGCPLIPTRVSLPHTHQGVSPSYPRVYNRVYLSHPRVYNRCTSLTHGLTGLTPLIPTGVQGGNLPTGCTRREATYPRGIYQGVPLIPQGVYTRVYLSYLRVRTGCTPPYMPPYWFKAGLAHY